MPKGPLTKELVFYFASVIVVVVFAFFKQTGFYFCGTYLVLYICYLITTIYLAS